MSQETLRGPGPPFTGAVYVSARSKSGRRWEVTRQDGIGGRGWRLRPMGDDVRPAQDGGIMNGGPRHIWRTEDELRDRKRWRFVGLTTNGINVLPDGSFV